MLKPPTSASARSSPLDFDSSGALRVARRGKVRLARLGRTEFSLDWKRPKWGNGGFMVDELEDYL